MRNLAVVMLLAGSLVPRESRAQQAAPADNYDARIFDDFFPANNGISSYATVILMANVAYRIELRGDSPGLPVAQIVIRSLHQTSAPPVVQTPLSDPTLAEEGRSYMLIASTSGEYRLDVETADDLYVRIVRDARETRRWAGVVAGGGGSGIHWPWHRHRKSNGPPALIHSSDGQKAAASLL